MRKRLSDFPPIVDSFGGKESSGLLAEILLNIVVGIFIVDFIV